MTDDVDLINEVRGSNDPSGADTISASNPAPPDVIELLPTLYEIERLLEHLDEFRSSKGRLIPSDDLPTRRKPPPANLRLLGKPFNPAKPFTQEGAMVSLLVRMRHALMAEGPKSARPESVDRSFIEALLDAQESIRWTLTLPMRIDRSAIRNALSEIRPGSTNWTLARDRRQDILNLLDKAQFISNARREALARGGGGRRKPFRPGEATELVDAEQQVYVAATPNRFSSSGELFDRFADLSPWRSKQDAAYGLWLFDGAATGADRLEPIVPRFEWPGIETIDRLSDILVHDLRRCVMQWHKALDDGSRRRNTTILPRPWIARADTTDLTGTLKLAVRRSLEMLDVRRPANDRLRSERVLIFLRRFGPDAELGMDPGLIDQELCRVLDLRSKVRLEIGRSGTSELWKAFRKENDKPRRMDTHDWNRDEW